MELRSITNEILQVSQRLGKSSKEIFRLGQEKAEAERNYRIKLGQELLKLKSEGMAIGLINDVARSNVADYLFERDRSEAIFRAAMEAMSALKSQLTALQSVLRVQSDV